MAQDVADYQLRQAVPDLRRLLSDPEGSVRGTAAGALACLGDRESIQAIRGLLQDAHATARGSAAHALGRLGATEALDDLDPLLEDDAPHVRRSAVVALGSLGAPQARIAGALEDPAKEIRLAAAWALVDRGSREGLPIILKEETGSLTGLNRLRHPESWSRLSTLPWVEVPPVSWEEAMERISSSAGLAVEVKAHGEVRSLRAVRTVGQALEILTSGNGPQVILEADRLRILSRHAALDFWRAWDEPDEKN